MPTRSFKPSRRRSKSGTDPEATYREALEQARKRRQGYRERSLAIHGSIARLKPS